MTNETKVIIVADEMIHAFFTEKYEGEWDTQQPVSSIADMWAGLQSGALSDTSKIIIVSDHLYTESKEEFEQAVSTLAQHNAMVAVISYDSSLAPVIQENVNRAMIQHFGQESEIYFIDPQHPVSSTNDAIERYIAITSGQNPDIASEGSYAEEEHDYSDVPERAENPNVDTSHDGLLIASTSSKGGSGKSTVSITLASQIALSSLKAYEEGKVDKPLKVCVVDLDIRDGQVGFLIGQSVPTALNVRIAPDWGPETIQNNLVFDEKGQFHALLAPKSGRTAEDTGPDFYQEVIRILRTMFDVVILDTSVFYLDPLSFDVVFPEANAILFITNLSIASVFGMTRWFSEIVSPVEEGGAGISKQKIGIVVNGSVPNVNMDKNRIAAASTGTPIVGAIPLDTAAFLSAGNKNRLADMLLHQEIGPAYFDLATKIIGKRSVLSPLVEPAAEEGNVGMRSRKKDSLSKAVPVAQASKSKGKGRFFRR